MFSVSAPLTEPIAVPDIFVSGLARIEDLGSCFRFTYFSNQRPLQGDAHDLERVVVARIVMPKDAAAVGMMHAKAAFDTEVFLTSAH